MDELDSDAIGRQSAALASHLSHAGIDWIPKARPAAVDAWRDRMRQHSGDGNDSVETTSSGGPLESSSPAQAPPSPDQAPPPPPAAPPAVTETAKPSATLEPAMFSDVAKPYSAPAPADQRQTILEQQSAEVAQCTLCPALVACRTHTVYGEGNANARFVFLGEGPGANEDATGRPFVGQAGNLLDKMIVACQMKRSDVYICNAVKCRPPGNRNPEPSELENCRPYFEVQLETIQPEYIVCLGAVAAQTLLETKATVGRLRGSLHRYRDSKVLVTYHPAYLLRNPKAKGAAWTDLKMVMADAGVVL